MSGVCVCVYKKEKGDRNKAERIEIDGWMDGDGHIHLTGLGHPPNINSLTVTNARLAN